LTTDRFPGSERIALVVPVLFRTPTVIQKPASNVQSYLWGMGSASLDFHGQQLS
jgi:hypothetical protein